MYPDAKIWIVGHSLGGALASLIGLTFGAPTVAFEAPGERMAAQRLHLPIPVSRPSVLQTHLSVTNAGSSAIYPIYHTCVEYCRPRRNGMLPVLSTR